MLAVECVLPIRHVTAIRAKNSTAIDFNGLAEMRFDNHNLAFKEYHRGL